MVVSTNAVVDPDTMVVGFLNAGSTDATVFAAGWFGELAGMAGRGR